ncbi:hypothetical protein NLG97_g1313 [Lecanicillium saksenae]|uniref:Uncharacterized protein n=1 Tax=Lecanicillium saksenae TaxID=468837 RepID=A0ACC1R420_9HYPO|nr:hypothetical protein NLG97_g1313 [Lecanicillium saksenae]
MGCATILLPTCKGYLASEEDALVLVEACLSGQLHHVPRGPSGDESLDIIQSGSIFVYETGASGLREWVDGSFWRFCGMQGRISNYTRHVLPCYEPHSSVARAKDRMLLPEQSWSGKTQKLALGRELGKAQHSMQTNRLTKQVVSATFQGITHHIICYVALEDVLAGQLETVTNLCKRDFGITKTRTGLVVKNAAPHITCSTSPGAGWYLNFA